MKQYTFLGPKPYQHQLKTIDFLLNNKRCYNFSSLGSGKTMSSLYACDMLFEARKIKKVLIVCPLSIMNPVWAAEIKNAVPNRSYSIVHGPRAKRLAALDKDVHFYITNIDALRTYWLELYDAGFDVVIIDEVDGFKNPSSKRSKGMVKVCNSARAVWGLTGSPMANSPMESFGIAKVVNPAKMPTKYVTRFRSLTMHQFGPYTWVPNERAEVIVHDMLQPAIAFKLEDCLDIPDITYEYREFPMAGKQAKYYKEMYNEQLIEVEQGEIVASTAAVKYNKLLQISAGAVYREDGGVEVLNAKDKIDDILRVQKAAGRVIVFVQFVEVIKLLADKLPNAKIIYGSISQTARTATLKSFEAGEFEILIAQPRVAAHGLNLQYCNHIIFFGPILGNSYYRQAIGRIRRSGQTKKQVIINYYSSSAEKQLYKMLKTKEISSQILMDLMYK